MTKNNDKWSKWWPNDFDKERINTWVNSMKLMETQREDEPYMPKNDIFSFVRKDESKYFLELE